MRLVINPDFFGDLSEPHQQGLLKHELLHIAFGHIVLADRYPNKKLFNIAADIEINQYIAEHMCSKEVLGGIKLWAGLTNMEVKAVNPNMAERRSYSIICKRQPRREVD